MGLKDLFNHKPAKPADVHVSKAPAPEPKAEKPPETPVAGHWGILCDTPEEVHDLVFKPIEHGQRVEAATLEGRNAFGHLLEEGPFRLVTITADSGQVLTFYPMAEGMRHRAVFTRALPYNPAFEGDVEIAMGPATFTVFDPMYFKDHAVYRAGENYDIALSGLAYFLNKADEEELCPDGQVRSMRGFAGFRPDEQRGVSEYVCRSPVKAVEQVQANGHQIFRLTLTLFRVPEECGPYGDVDFYLYVRQDQLNGYVPKAGDDVVGAMWLLGYLAG